jgi:hypothetical protein
MRRKIHPKSLCEPARCDRSNRASGFHALVAGPAIERVVASSTEFIRRREDETGRRRQPVAAPDIPGEVGRRGG